MEATDYRIRVKGISGECRLTIDNIYTKYGQGRTQGRTQSGITYWVTGSMTNSSLIINIVGDNRVGGIHYNNRWQDSNNKLIFKGNGALTVASYGADDNWWNAAIGNSDNYSSCYGIQIDGGIIFAGTKKSENCTAIGGGGNGVGKVTINGGVVTAVAATTGTAIGGGIGFNSTGGIGLVTITGGTVYAYNLDNGHYIPSSAIGSAGSRDGYGSG